MQMKSFSTSDFFLSVTLCVLGHKLISIDKSDQKRNLFNFAEDSTIQQNINLFYSDDLKLNPRIVLLQSKLVKDRLFARS